MVVLGRFRSLRKGKIIDDCYRIHDALLTRLSNDDDMEKSLSTFANEMTSCAMILGTFERMIRKQPAVIIAPGIATSNSLVLIDEVGRGTSPNEGIGISHAIAEELIKAKVSSCEPLL